jgi:trehalose-6-phosphate synthase
VVCKHYQEGDLIWVHDYHLMLLPLYLKKKLPEASVGFFLHIPFPTSEIFRILPVREELLRGILSSDLVGFHTPDYLNHVSILRGTEQDEDEQREKEEQEQEHEEGNEEDKEEEEEQRNRTSGRGRRIGRRVRNELTSDFFLQFSSAAIQLLGVPSTPTTITYNARVVSLGVFPVGIEPEKFLDGLQQEAVHKEIEALR